MGQRDRKILLQQVGEYSRGLKDIASDLESISAGLRRNAPDQAAAPLPAPKAAEKKAAEKRSGEERREVPPPVKPRKQRPKR